jgi:ribonuclease HI
MAVEKLKIFTDGGARGNPGPAGIGVAVYSADGKLLKKHSQYLGERTNNEAEYEAVIAALSLAAAIGASELSFYLDSELVVRQLTGIYRVRNSRMQELLLRVRNLETKFKKIKYQNIPREKNRLADKLVNEAIDKHEKTSKKTD